MFVTNVYLLLKCLILITLLESNASMPAQGGGRGQPLQQVAMYLVCVRLNLMHKLLLFIITIINSLLFIFFIAFSFLIAYSSCRYSQSRHSKKYQYQTCRALALKGWIVLLHLKLFNSWRQIKDRCFGVIIVQHTPQAHTLTPHVAGHLLRCPSL